MKPSPLQTDLYQLTMAAAWRKSGKAGMRAVFHLFFRRLPFGGGYAVAAGIEPALEWLREFQFSAEDLQYLASLENPGGGRLLEPAFLDELAGLKLRLDVDAVPEGSVVFAHEPLLRVEGPLWHAQLAETALLNIINFQTLIATKAARICEAAGGAPVIEFGFRRAQGPDGALSATRAAWIGGCAATSNVLAGKIFGIPVRGTHAHSWVMAFGSEREAFERYVEAMPRNAVLLVDTYDTLQGVEHAIEVARELRARGHELAGIRLDSGDLAWLSQRARERLDAEGFPGVKILASNDLDERIIESLRHQGAKIDAWGVGTELVTGGGQAALGGVYKLAAVQEPGGPWRPCVKRSDERGKSSIPGRLQTRRFVDARLFAGDAIFDCEHPPGGGPVEIVDPDEPLRRKRLRAGLEFFDMLEPAMREGQLTRPSPTLESARARCRQQLEALHPTIRRLVNPHRYPAGLELSLHHRRESLIHRLPMES